MNRHKQQKTCSSIFLGVSFDKRSQKKLAQIRTNTINKFVGYFASEEDAARAYNQKPVEYFGEAAKLNDISD